MQIVAKRPLVTLEDLQGSAAQVEKSVKKTTSHKSDIYGSVAKRSLFNTEYKCTSDFLDMQNGPIQNI